MKHILITIFLIFFFPVVAYANAGVPMIFLSYPVMILALLPVIFIETSIFKRVVPIPYKNALVSNGAEV
jgi:hypothetical protein